MHYLRRKTNYFPFYSTKPEAKICEATHDFDARQIFVPVVHIANIFKSQILARKSDRGRTTRCKQKANRPIAADRSREWERQLLKPKGRVRKLRIRWGVYLSLFYI